MAKDKVRCPWCLSAPVYQDYHDFEWGVPLKDDRKLFEFLILEGAQAGLSWLMVLKKRENYRKAFDDFSAEKIARYDAKKIKQLLANEGIIRNRLKLESAVINAKAYLALKKEQGSFSGYLWSFVSHKPIQNRWKSLQEIPARTPESDAMSLDLKKRGFKFTGSTICYALMQACGMVNDHLVSCYRYREI